MPVHAGLQDVCSEMHVFYLHGFASSAHSSKATFFARAAARARRHVASPGSQRAGLLDADDHPDGRAGRGAVRSIAATGRPVAADRIEPRRVRRGAMPRCSGRIEIGRLVLLAPALDFGGNRHAAAGRARPRRVEGAPDQLNVFHFGYGRMMPVHYELYADARALRRAQRRADDADPGLPGPARHGGRSRPPSKHGPRARPNVELHMLDDDHQLRGSLDYIWARLAPIPSAGLAKFRESVIREQPIHQLRRIVH